MSPSRPFILRPVATSLLMVAILLAGFVAYLQLPVSALPEVDFPTMQIVTFYPGASPDVIASAVTAPLEKQFGQVPGLNQMTSISASGASIITLQFLLNLNIDVAEQEVQAAINAAQTYLPTDLPTPPIYSKTNPADAPILTLALSSKTLQLSKVEDYADTRMAQKISQLPGVGLVSISGGQKPAVRIQTNPMQLASYGLNLDDVRTSLVATSVDQAKGSFDGPHQSYQIGANDQILTSKDYREVVIAFKNGAPVMLKDVANVLDGSENVKQLAWMGEGGEGGTITPAVIMNIQRQPGANIIQVVDSIKALMPRLRNTLPSSVDVKILTDRTLTVRASVEDVQFELMLTVGLVVMVIFLFLRTLSATVIPSVAVPLSLIGTFAVMYALGYSLNNLTLMALTISTGFVVDDAIVMLENISRYLEEGLSPMQAALQGAQQIGFTIISLTISLIAVLIPLLFMGDIVGRLFREFAVTLSVTILISAFVSLTLTPMMAARILKHTPEAEQTRFYHYTEGLFKRIIAAYGRSLRWVFRFEVPMLIIAFAMLVLTVVLYIEIPKGFFPTQDTGIIQGISQAPESISFTAMARKQQQLAHEILKDPAVQSLSSFIGADGVNTTLNSGRIQINLKDPAIRGLTASEVIRRLDRNLRVVPGIQLYMQPVQDLTVDDRASRTEYQYTLEDPDPAELGLWTGKLVDAMRKLPQVRDVATDDQPNGVTAQLAIDRPPASRMNIPTDTIDSTLYDAFGQRQISTLYTQSNQYHIILEAVPEFQKDPRKLDSLYVQGAAPPTVAGAPASTSGRSTTAASSVSTLAASSNANSSTTQGTQLSSSSGSSSSSSFTSQNNTVNNASSTASPTGSNLVTGTPTNSLSSTLNSSTSSSAPANQTSGQVSGGGAASTSAMPTPVPLSAFTHFEMKPSPLTISHQGQFPVVTVSFNVAEGSSLGQAVDAVKRVQAHLNMPASVIVGFQGTAAAYTAIGGNEALLIIAALLAVYIVLGVLYESFIHPLTILSTLPSAGVGALLALRLFGQSLDIIAVIGIILLIGIVKKNGIMIVDFALEAERVHGKNPVEAIYEASLLRFRPILMTTLAALFAGIPLAFGAGIGSELRRPLGIAMVGGLLVSQVLTLYTTPIIYIFFDRIATRFSRRPHATIATPDAGATGA